MWLVGLPESYGESKRSLLLRIFSDLRHWFVPYVVNLTARKMLSDLKHWFVLSYACKIYTQ